jgi:Bacterial SH3 domain.
MEIKHKVFLRAICFLFTVSAFFYPCTSRAFATDATDTLGEPTIDVAPYFSLYLLPNVQIFYGGRVVTCQWKYVHYDAHKVEATTNRDLPTGPSDRKLGWDVVTYAFHMETRLMAELQTIYYFEDGQIAENYNPPAAEIEWREYKPGSIGERIFKYMEKTVSYLTNSLASSGGTFIQERTRERDLGGNVPFKLSMLLDRVEARVDFVDGMILGSAVNCREYPFLDAKIAGRLKKNANVAVIDIYEPDDSDIPWYRIIYAGEDGKFHGWVRGDLIHIPLLDNR